MGDCHSAVVACAGDKPYRLRAIQFGECAQMTTRTVYEWAPGRRGDLLMPVGSSSIQQGVQVTGDVLEKLYREGRLTGRALEDAKRMTDGEDIS